VAPPAGGGPPSPASLVAAEHAILTAIDGGSDVTGWRTLEAVVAAAAPLVHARLLHLMLARYRLSEHLRALHRYVLLSAGDFASLLLAAAAPELSRPGAAHALGVHALDGLLEAALRSSNAQREDRDVLARLSVRLLAPSPGDSGWDVFQLAYAVTPPLTAVVTPAAAASYARLFVFLWRVKRADHELSSVWTAAMSAGHGIRGLRHGGLDRVLHACALVRADMTSLVSTLSSYLGLEVLAHAASVLESDVACARGLDDLVSAHERYLAALLDRTFLSPRTAPVAAPLARLLSDALRFAGVLHTLLDAAVEQVAAWRAHVASVSKRGAQGETAVAAFPARRANFGAPLLECVYM